MSRPLSPSVLFRSLCLPALLALAASLGCVDHNPTGTTLFVYDNQSSTVQIWADVNTVHDAVQNSTAMPAADRSIQSSLLNNIDLAWGGLAVDPNRQMLYLVSESGVVYAITKANTQNGSISNNTDIFETFRAMADALREYFSKNGPTPLFVVVGRGGPNLVRGMGAMRDTLEVLGLPYRMFGFDSDMSAVINYARVADAWMKAGGREAVARALKIAPPAAA